MAEPIPLTGRPSLEIEAKLHRGLADPSRLAILRELRRGPLTAGQLAGLVGLTPQRASNHLRCLLECGLIEIEPRGRFNIYRLADPAVGRLLDASARVLAEVAPLIEACLNYGPPNRRALRAATVSASLAAGRSDGSA
ncbi:MAG: ArsR/SmtB family transcription factor [Candidatus Limnocylindrales bacterium]